MLNLTKEKSNSVLISTQIKQMLGLMVDYGSLAPNSHNAQMWNVHMAEDENSIELKLNKDRLLSEIDPDNREAWISCGAFVYNACHIAEINGYETCFFIKNTNEIKIKILPGKTKNEIIGSPLICKQKTTRKPFFNYQISEEIINSIVGLSDKVNYYPRNSKAFDSIVSLSKAANISQMNHKSKLEEMSKWIRFSDKESQLHKDGINIKELGITGIAQSLIKYFFNRKNFLHSVLFRKIMIFGQNQLFNKCNGYIVIRSNTLQQYDCVQTGMLMQKVWFSCTDHNLCVQPMSQVIEETQYKKKLEEELGINDEIQMLFRIGYCRNSSSTIPKRRIKISG